MKRIFYMVIVLVLILTCFSFTVAASDYMPTLSQSLHYLEVPPHRNLVVSWNAPIQGNVTHYLFSLRELSELGTETNIPLVNRANVGSSARSYTIPGSMIEKGCYYRLAIGAVNSDGNTYWLERNFFSGISRGVTPGRIISLKIYTGFSFAEKEAIYYSARNWYNALGREVINTYSYDQGVNSTDYVRGDGISVIVPSEILPPDWLMATSVHWDDNGYTDEIDLLVNRYYSFSNGAQPGKFDFQSVVTHELGHAYGLSDKYESIFSHWTMYGNGTLNSTEPASLYYYDIEDLRSLYNRQNS